MNELCNDWDLVDCALMSIGDYGQKERKNNRRYQYGSKSLQIAWDALFHKGANYGFEITSEVLIKLLSKAELFTNDSLREIIDAYVKSCEETSQYPWRYYYVKYKAFRPGSFGKYSNDDVVNTPYMFSVMQTRTQWSSNTYKPYLKEADDEHLSRDFLGQRLVYGDQHIICTNNAYVLRDNETEEVRETIPIKQNEEGVDIEDRVIVLKKFIEKLNHGSDT